MKDGASKCSRISKKKDLEPLGGVFKMLAKTHDHLRRHRRDAWATGLIAGWDKAWDGSCPGNPPAGGPPGLVRNGWG